MKKEKTGRPPLDFTEDEILAAVLGSNGIMTRVSNSLGCAYDTARKYMAMYPAAQAAFADEIEKVLDVAESKLFKAINSDDMESVKWFLSRRGKHRGYSERTEVTGPDGGQLELKTRVIEIPVNGSDTANKPT